MADIQITTGGQERVQAATELLSEAFKTDPTIIYLLSSLTPEHRAAYRPNIFRAILTAAASNDAAFDEISGWKSCGVIFPPGSDFDKLGPSLYPTFIFRMLWEMAPLTKACKAKALREGEKYYYVYFLGTREDGRGQGLCSALVKHYQSTAAREHVPIYLEAGTEYSWRLYERLGFVTVDEIVLGKGKAAADGTVCVGGPGVSIWGMIWRPEKIA